MEASFSFNNHPVIVTLRMKGVHESKSSDRSNQPEKEKYNETQLHQIFNKLELSTSIINAFNEIPYYRHFDPVRLQKLISLNVNFPTEISQAVPYYILHAAISFCFELEESYNSNNLSLVLKSLIFLIRRYQLSTAEHMFYFLLKFASYNALTIDTQLILDIVESLVKVKGGPDSKLLSALIFWASNTRSVGLVMSQSVDGIKGKNISGKNPDFLDESTKMVLSYTDELLKRFKNCITPEDASLLFSRIENPLKKLDPFCISMFFTVFKFLPKEVLTNFYANIPQNIIDFMHCNFQHIRYKSVDATKLHEAETINPPKVPQIIHGFRENLFFTNEIKFQDFEGNKPVTDKILSMYNMMVCSTNRDLISEAMMEKYEDYIGKKRFYDFVSCFLQLTNSSECYVPFFKKLFETDIFDPRITIFGEQTEEVTKMLELRTLALEKILENKFVCLSDLMTDFIKYPEISAEIFMRLSKVQNIEAKHFLDFPRLGILYIPSYQQTHIELNIELSKDPENESLKEKIRIVERCRLAVVQFFIETMKRSECFKVYSHNDEFFSLLFSLAYEKQLTEIIIDSVFAHFEDDDEEFLKQIPDIISVLTSSKVDFTSDNVELVTKILQRLCTIEKCIVKGMDQVKRNILDSFSCDVTFTQDYLVYAIRFISLLSSKWEFTDKDSAALSKAITKICGSEPFHLVQIELISLIAGKQLDALSPDFLIKEPCALPLLIKPFENCSRLKGLISFISQLCIFSTTNSRQCQKGKLDLALLDLLLSRYHKLGANVDDPSEARLISESLSLVEKISSIASSRTTVQKFITMFCPIDGKFVSPLLPQAVKAMTSILVNSHNIPSGFLPLTNMEPYIEVSGLTKFDVIKGFTACFWVFVDSGSSRHETRLFTVFDIAGNFISISLAKSLVSVTINGESNTFPHKLGQEEWVFFAVTFEKGKNCTNVKVYFKDFPDGGALQYKAFDFEIGYLNCHIGKQLPDEDLGKNEHPVLLGPFAIYQPINDPNTLHAMDNAGTHYKFDTSLFSVYFEEEGTILTLKTRKEYSATAKIVGPSVSQMPLFQDVFLRSYQVTSLIPLFAQANISDKIEVKPIINLIKTVLSISSEAQGDFEKYSRFTVIAYLLKKFDIDIYTAFYEMFVMFQSRPGLQYQIVTEILTSIKLLSIAPHESQVQITNHWLNSILPLMKEQFKVKNNFRSSLLKIVEHFHEVCPEARDNVFKCLLCKADYLLKQNSFLELLTQCQKTEDESVAYELIKLLKNILSLKNVPLTSSDLQQLMVIYNLMRFKSVRIVSILLDIIVILDEKELIKDSLLTHIEVVRILIPKETMNDEFLVDVLKRSQTMPYFFPLACYALAVHPDTLQPTFVKHMPEVCDEYNRANKAWPFWPFIAAITCGGDTMNAIFEFVLKSSVKIWETVYVILEITAKLLNTQTKNPQNQFFTIMSTIASGNKQNDQVFRKLCFTYIFTKKGQTHNKAIVNAILNSNSDFVNKDFLAEEEDIDERITSYESFESRLKELSRFQKFTYGLGMSKDNKWEDHPLSYVLGANSQPASIITNYLETRLKTEDCTEEIEEAVLEYNDEIDLVSIEFNRLCTFIGMFLEKAVTKSEKFSSIKLFKIHDPVYQNVAAQWKTLWTQQTIESAPWSSSIIVRDRHFMRDQTICYGSCPMKMKLNKHFTNHNDAAVMRDRGAVEAKKLIESEQKNLEEKYKKEALPELLQVSKHIEEEQGPCGAAHILYKYEGELINLTHTHPCILNIFSSGIKIDVNINNTTKTILIKNNSIRRISYRPYLYHPTGIEIFCYDGSSHLINLKTRSTSVLKQIAAADGWQKCSIQTEPAAQTIMDKQYAENWAKGGKSNFEYLMYLNLASGRTFSDTSLYPVMPWIIADFTSETLDLKNPETYRDLSKPVGALNEDKLKKLLNQRKDEKDPLYSSFYVNPLSVCGWLIRMEPFTTLHTELQSGRFDNANHIFTSVADAYKSVTTNINDFRELIPEFYFCPHFLKNENDFDLGTVQSNTKINDVELPPWAESPFDFIYKMRKALESDYVSENLNQWIDLIWGVDSRGEGAIKSFNTFDPNIYESAWKGETINNPEKRSLIEATMKHNGQIPIQLFCKRHIKRSVQLDLRSDSFETGLSPVTCSFINNKIISIDKNSVISCYDQNSVEEIEHLSFHQEEEVPIACFSGKVAVASPLGYIEIFDIEKHASLMKVCPHTCKSSCLSVSTRFVCSGGTDSTLYLFDHLMMNNGSIPLFRDEVVDCSISDTFHIAAAITKDSFLFIVDTVRVIVRHSLHLDDAPRFVSITPSWGFIVVVTGSLGNEHIYVYSSDGELIRQSKVFHLAKICTFSNRFGFDYICVADDKGALKCVEAYYVNKLSETSKSYPAIGPLAALCYDSGRICAITKTGRCVKFTPDYLSQ